MKNVLVIFYSRDGRTKKVAEMIAEELSADIEELFDTRKRKGFFGYLKAGRDALKKKLTILKPIKSEIQDYDLVVIGTPVWVGTMTPAARTVLENYRFKKLAFFAVSGDKKDQGVFTKMAQSSKNPIATLHFSTKEVKEGKVKPKIKNFIRKLKG